MAAIETLTPTRSLALVSNRPQALGELAGLAASATAYADESLSPATRRAYSRQLAAFSSWASERGLSSFPAAPATVALYLASMADTGSAAATIDQALASISQAHRLAGLDSPTGDAKVRAVRRGVRRTIGTAQQKKAPAVVADLRRLVDALPDGLLGLRDRALLTLGFGAALRRSELVALDVSDLAFSDEGLTVVIRRSKTDQEGEGQRVGVATGRTSLCAVRAVRAWLAASGIESGPLFRRIDRHGNVGTVALSGQAVALVVQRAAAAAGLDAATFGGHSLRSGFATSAARAGKGLPAIMRQGRWRSVAIATGYIRDASLFADNASADLL